MIDRDRLRSLREGEDNRFTELHPESAGYAGRARRSLLAGVRCPG